METKDTSSYKDQFWDLMKNQFPDTYGSLSSTKSKEDIDLVIKTLLEVISRNVGNELIRLLSTEGFRKGIDAATEIKKYLK